jgi:hypothetical protein
VTLTLVVRGVTFNRAGVFSSIAVIVAFVACPEYLLSAWGVDMRIVPVGAMCVLLTLAPKRDSKGILAASLVLYGSFLAYWTYAYIGQSRRVEAVLAILETVERHSRIGQITVGACDKSRVRPLPVTQHAKGLMINRKQSFIQTWNIEGQNTLQVDYPAAGKFEDTNLEGVMPARCAREGVPHLETTLAEYPVRAFDYVLMVGPIPAGTKLPSSFQFVRRNAEAALFRVSAEGADRS